MASGFPDTVVASPDDVERALDVVQSVGAVGVKVPLEKGFGPSEPWPIHSAEVRAALARGAARRGLPIFVHATHEDEQAMALDMGARVLLHTSFYDAPPSDAFVARLAASGAFVVTTFSIMDAQLTRWHPERLDDPLLRVVVPEVERRTAADPAAGVYLAQHEMSLVFPRVPGIAHRLLAWLFTTETAVRGRLQSCTAAAKRFFDARVPVAVGSDAANWDAVPYQFFGTSTLREMELLADAGVPAKDVIVAATRTPARLLGLETEIGTVEVGKRADLVIVDGDPLSDLRAMRSVRWAVRAGIAKTPAEWMAAATPPAG
jgi:imidazolonepropionase-like amidohydrolase